MDFIAHKRWLIGLIGIELLFAAFPALEFEYGLYALMGVIYFGVTFWFVFGARRWWLYQVAGVAYVFNVVIARFVFIARVPLPPWGYHVMLAAGWGVVLTIHLFVERAIAPPQSKPDDSRSLDRRFPD